MSKTRHGFDLRKGRISIPGHYYLITAVTKTRKCFFSDLDAGRIVIRQMMRSDAVGWTNTHAFVVMPDHLHWLFELVTDMSLATVVGNVKRHSSREIMATINNGKGPVWQRGFHDHAMRTDESVIAAARYIIANPLRAGLVRRVGDYPLWDAVWL